MTLPLKWKLYRVFNYILLISSLVVLVLIVIAWSSGPPRSSDRIFVFLMAFLFLLLFLHCLGNLFVMSKNFPDKILSGYKRNLNIFSLVSSILTIVGLAFFLIAGFVTEFEEDAKSNDPTGKIILAILASLWLINVFILVCQFQVAGFLKKNDRRAIELMIESIGNDQ